LKTSLINYASIYVNMIFSFMLGKFYVKTTILMCVLVLDLG